MSHRIRSEQITSLRLSQRLLAALLELTTHVQDWQPEPDEWSFRLIAAHLVTVERDCYAPRVKRIAAGEDPFFSRYANTGVDLNCGDLRDSLERWRTLRDDLLDYVATLSADELHRTGTHEVYGTITTVDALSELAEHDLRQFRHVEQLIEDYLEAMDEAVNEEVDDV